MKRAFTYTLMLLMAAFTLTSCEPDMDAGLAYDMEGVWEGRIEGEFYSWRHRSNDYASELSFTRKDFYGGTGYEIDRNNNTGRVYRNRFSWEVRNNRIYIDYDDGSSVVIRDYEVYSQRGVLRFRGFFDDCDTNENLAAFDMVKVER